ncbi:PqiC family protein [Modicisalibacter zincidurans]|uniref:Membrane integrity-associated transporter subunit PqiC n=1 Tax=Modicisalibacter zincidurans TaxID=1178777 RepID=A0ABP9RCP9_9GAMM|nr:ABC-type transport auxiliary lipoprotein family protein [Halomonas zincidurans]
MTRRLRGALMVGALFALAGCAGSPTTERYTLPAPMNDAVSGVGPSDAATPDYSLVIDRVSVAGYLDNPGIVLQPDAIRLRQASSHQWAEALDQQLGRGLRQRLAAELPDTRILVEGDPPEALHLQVNVEQFQGHYQGVGMASGYWQLRAANGDLLLERNFSASTPLAKDGYPALVRALGASWDKVAANFAAQIRRLRASGTVD